MLHKTDHYIQYDSGMVMQMRSEKSHMEWVGQEEVTRDGRSERDLHSMVS
jgi:hypothetical protein